MVGNNAYRSAPLLNAVNDARAMGGLFQQAGFSVELCTDAKRVDMLAALDRFSDAIQMPETKEVVFYYGGHAAQLEWRNYLLPIDAEVKSVNQINERCIDLRILLARLSAAKGRTFIIILDACRDNPFGGTYQPERKGLSQFDAPVGSLLAYATSPGRSASDGAGVNGLYTENLVRELSIRTVRFEDALKRVRLNVRLASRGAQIPWETTSLENDFFLFASGRKKLSDAELEKQFEADVAAWTSIQKSQKTEDWVAYIRDFPNGRFCEIAQIRLARLLAATEGQPATGAAISTAGHAGLTHPANGEKSIPQIQNEMEYNALPKGKAYLDPKGNLRRKS